MVTEREVVVAALTVGARGTAARVLVVLVALCEVATLSPFCAMEAKLYDVSGVNPVTVLVPHVADV
jgi:hypothetical protein